MLFRSCEALCPLHTSGSAEGHLFTQLKHWILCHTQDKFPHAENGTGGLSENGSHALLISFTLFHNSVRDRKGLVLLRSCSFSSVQFSYRSVVSYSLWPHESQHARPPCPSPSPGVHWNSRPSNQWCYPAISSSVVPFSSCPQSLPASESFPMSQLFAWGRQSTGVSALADSFWYLAKLIQFCKV